MTVQEAYPHYRTATTTEGPGGSNVGTTTAAIAAANSSRSYFHVCNTHATQVLYLAFGENAVAAKGITLQAGECYEMKGSSIFTGAINGIASGATTTYTFVEW